MLEVIEGLKAAGVKTNDIFVYDRYRGEFMDAGMHKAVPDGIKWGGLTPEDDGIAAPDRLARASATTRSPATTATSSSR